MAMAFATSEMQKHNFFRPLDWRWQAALRIAVRPRRKSDRVADPEVLDLVRFVREEDRPSRSKHESEQNDRWSDLRQAIVVQDQAGLRRDEIQARILAGETDDAIGHRCALSPGAIGWFEKAFFCVRDRLAAGDWVAAIVLGGWRPYLRSDIGRVWKAMAHIGGPSILDLVMAVTQRRPLPSAVTATFHKNSTYEASRLRLLVELNVLVLQVNTVAELKQLVDLYQEAQEVDRNREGVTVTLNSDLRVAGKMLGLAVANERPKSKPTKRSTQKAATNPANAKHRSAPRTTPTPTWRG